MSWKARVILSDGNVNYVRTVSFPEHFRPMRGDHFTFMIGDNLTRFVIETTEYQLDGNELPVSINCAYETPDLMIKPIIKYLEKLGWEEE